MHQRTTDAEDRITIARLDGTARRLLENGATGEQAIDELHKITADPTLLARASGSALGAWRASQKTGHGGREVARMMVLAGADEEVLAKVADEVAAAMAQRMAWGS